MRLGECVRAEDTERAQELKQREEKKKIPWHIIEGHFGAKLLIDKSTNLPGRR